MRASAVSRDAAAVRRSFVVVMADKVEQAVRVLTQASRPYATQGRPPADMRKKDESLVFPPAVMPVTKSMVGKGPQPSKHTCKSLADAAGGYMALVAVADKSPSLLATTWTACVVIFNAECDAVVVRGIKGAEYVRACEAYARDLADAGGAVGAAGVRAMAAEAAPFVANQQPVALAGDRRAAQVWAEQRVKSVVDREGKSLAEGGFGLHVAVPATGLEAFFVSGSPSPGSPSPRGNLALRLAEASSLEQEIATLSADVARASRRSFGNVPLSQQRPRGRSESGVDSGYVPLAAVPGRGSGPCGATRRRATRSRWTR